MKRNFIVDNQSGGVLVLIALMLVVVLGIMAFVIDIGHLLVVRNELKNAADAGALAGARVLYSSVTGTQLVINGTPGAPSANEVAYNAATTNSSDRSPVEVPTVEKGHWCFTCDGNKGRFITNDSVTTYATTTLSFSYLDTDENYINAVRVVAARSSAASFFAGIFGDRFRSFSLSAESVAWKGFAGSSFKVDEPIAICYQSVYDEDGNLVCTVGKMTNANDDTGAWTNTKGCGVESTNGSTVPPLICNVGGISGADLGLGQALSTNEGAIESAMMDLRTCWETNDSLDSDGDPDHTPDRVWTVTLPLVDCGDESTPTCKTLKGAIKVEIFWITGEGNDPQFNRIPEVFDIDPGTSGMEYNCPATCSPAPCPSLETDVNRKRCWIDFLKKFGIEKDRDGNILSPETPGYTAKTIYFKPSCTLAEDGGSGGAPSNVMAKYPKLVR